MKTSATIFLTASLALNAVLIALVLRGGATPPPRETTAAPTPSPAAPTIDASIWPRFAGGELPDMVARLRRAGFPPGVVRALVAARLDEIYAARRRALDPAAETRPFWQSGPSDPKILAARSQLDREQTKELRELLGSDEDADAPLLRALYRHRHGHLPSDLAAQVRRLEETYSEKRSQTFGVGLAPSEDTLRRAALNVEEREAVARLLTPEQLEKYELRTSFTAANLRNWQTPSFVPTEEEFLTIFRLSRAMDVRTGTAYWGSTEADRQLRNEAYQQLNEQLKAALGSERLAEFTRSRGAEYQQISKLAVRLELPPAAANQVWEVKNDVQLRAESIRRDPALSSEARDTRLTALATEAQSKVTAALGARGLEAYKQYGGAWMNTLQPRPPTPPRN